MTSPVGGVLGRSAHESHQRSDVFCQLKPGKETAVTRLFAYLYSHDKGASMVEYSLLVLLIAIVAFVGVALAGNQLSETYSEISSDLVNAGN